MLRFQARKPRCTNCAVWLGHVSWLFWTSFNSSVKMKSVHMPFWVNIKFIFIYLDSTFFFFFFFIFWLCLVAGVQDPSLAYQGLNPHPLYRECRVLSTGPTKEVSSVKFKSVSLEWVLVYLICTSYYWCNSYFTICFPKLRTSRGPGNNIDLLLLLKDTKTWTLWGYHLT